MKNIIDIIYEQFTDFCNSNDDYKQRQESFYAALEELRNTLNPQQTEVLNKLLFILGTTQCVNEQAAVKFTIDFIKSIYM